MEETRKSMFSQRFFLSTNVAPAASVFLRRYQAVYNYLPRNEDELELKEGDIVDVMEKCDDGWFVGEFLWSSTLTPRYCQQPGRCEV